MHSRLLVVNSLKYASTESYPSSLWNYLNVEKSPEPSPSKDSDLIPTSPSASETFHPLEDLPDTTSVNPPRGAFISPKDAEGVATFVREFALQSVIPYMEKNMAAWNETIAASRKGLTGRFFTASKRYFNSGAKAPAPSSSSGGGSGPMSYHYTSPEAQLRKLADYAFMLQDYRFAMSIYDTVKKDFANDKALKHVAGTHVPGPVHFLCP